MKLMKELLEQEKGTFKFGITNKKNIKAAKKQLDVLYVPYKTIVSDKITYLDFESEAAAKRAYLLVKRAIDASLEPDWFKKNIEIDN